MRKIIVTRLFKETIQSTKEVIVHRGGARSGKSFSIAQYLIWRMMHEPNSKILVTRKTLPALRLTAYKLFIDLLKEYGYYQYCSHSLSNNTLIYRPTNAFVAFLSIDNPERIKSSEWNAIHMEEANEFSYNDYVILKTRLSAATTMGNRIILSLNPTSAYSWVKMKVIDKENVEELISNYKDNPFLSEAYIKGLEDLAKLDKNFYKIFCLGEWGSLENIIFDNWSVIDKIPSRFTESDKVYGVDWGFTHPSTLVSCIKDGDDLYVEELFYESGNTNAQLIDRFSSIIKGMDRATIYGDNAEPARLKEFRHNDIPIRPSVKGKNSIKNSIDFIKRHNVYITANSVNLIKELHSYSWQTDKNDTRKEVPVNELDDAIAAFRYAVYSHWGNETNYSIISPDEVKIENEDLI